MLLLLHLRSPYERSAIAGLSPDFPVLLGLQRSLHPGLEPKRIYSASRLPVRPRRGTGLGFLACSIEYLASDGPRSKELQRT